MKGSGYGWLGTALKAGSLAYALSKGKSLGGTRRKPPVLKLRGRKRLRGKMVAKRGGAGTTVTRQHDVSTSRVFRRPGYKKRRFIKFQNKVKAAVEAKNELITFVETHLKNDIQGTGPSSYTQIVQPLPIHAASNDYRLGVYGEDNAGLRRFIVELREKAYSAESTVGRVGPNYDDLSSTKFYLKSCQEVFTFKNNHSNEIYIDIYECQNRMNLNNIQFHTAAECWFHNLTDTYDFGLRKTGAAPFTAATQTRTVSGATPFTCPDFGAYWKVLKKTRVQIEPGSKINYTMYGYKGNVFFEKDLALGTISKGKVKDMFFVVNPTFNSDGPATLTDFLEVEATKKYTLSWNEAPGHQKGFSAFYQVV